MAAKTHSGNIDSYIRIEYILFMGSTTIHFQEKLLKEIDAAAKKHGMSRNKYVLRACGAELSKEEGTWSEDFFNPHVTSEDRQLLDEAVGEMENGIYVHRRNRGAPLL